MGLEKNEVEEKRGFEGSKFREEVFSKSVRAGKRTYFFDVKSTRKCELYLTITESKRINNSDGRAFYDKHKIFLYKEDFEKFVEGLEEIIKYIKVNQAELDTGFDEDDNYNEDDDGDNQDVFEDDFSNIEFEDLTR